MFNINSFSTIRHWEGSQHRAFEEIAYQLLREDVPAGSRAVRTGNPDGGVEWYATLPDGEEWGWQAKFVSNSASLLSGMTESVKRVAAERPQLVKLIFAISINLSTGTIGNTRTSDRQKYENKMAQWRSKIPGADRIEFEIIQESDLLVRLSLPEHRGRRWFWWHETVLDHDWLCKLQKRQETVAGERYRPHLQVDLPIQRDIEGLRVAQFIDDEFAELVYRMAKARPYFSENDLQQFPSLTNTLLQLRPKLDHFRELLTQKQPISRSLDDLDIVRHAASSCSAELRDVYNEVLHQRDLRLTSGDPARMKHDDESRSLSAILYLLSSIQENVQDIGEWLDKTPVCAAERGLYFLCGPAGSGKTHLFLDTARSALNDKRPALVLFGNRFENDLWSAISSQLGIGNLGGEELLGALEAAAGATPEGRLLILIDALNETPTKDYWRTNLPVLRASLQQYRGIALAVSCRDTYIEVVDRDNEREHFLVKTHPGFSGMEVEATQKYFDHYGLQTPRIPILLPEFSIPLLLKMYCESLQSSGTTDLALGHDGRISIFERYLKVKVEAVTRHVYDSDYSNTALQSRKLKIRKALGAVIDAIAQGTSPWISWEQAVNAVVLILQCTEDKANEILGSFENEGLLSKEPAHYRSDAEGIDVRITFQAFSDYLILSQRLIKYADPLAEDEFKAWLRENPFSGIMEVASVLIPEKYSVELPDLLDLQNQDDETPSHRARTEWIYRTYMNALPYRKSTSITQRTIDHLNVALSIERGSTSLYNIVYLIAPYPDNPLNALGLHRHLSQFSMAERDWQFGVATYWDIEEGTSPVSRLARWAAEGPYPDYPSEVIELSATALCWLLSSANRQMRDWVTKALVQLLHDRLDVMLALLDRFWSVNDPYVVQRVVLIGYGCLMRGGMNEPAGAKRLVENVITKFTELPLRMDELLLDAGKGIVDWGVGHELVPAEVSTSLARPHGFPKLGNPLTVESIEAKYETSYEAPKNSTFSTIFNSVMSYGDFGRYVIHSELYRFTRLARGEPLPPKPSSEWRLDQRAVRRFEKSLTAEQSKRLDSYFVNAKGSDLDFLFNPDAQSAPIELSAEQVRLLKAIWVPPPASKGLSFPSDIARRWLFLRTISLGWRPEFFGESDYYRTQRDDGRSEHKAERWGKKYQWIAFHELMARVADNYQTRPEWSEGQAEWDPYLRLEGLRDLDPSLPPVNYRDLAQKNEKANSWKPGELELPGQVGYLVSFASYHGDIDRFITERLAEPLAQVVALRTDESGQEWIAFHSYEGTKELIGDKREWGLAQTTNLHTWFVSDTDAERQAAQLLRVLEQSWEFATPSQERGAYWGELSWMKRPESWMTADWRTIGRENATQVQIIDTCEDYRWEGNGLDCSIEESAFAYVPSQYVRNREWLDVTDKGPGWKDERGREVFVNTQGSHEEYPQPHPFWARRDWTQAFLHRENLALVVAIWFERLSHSLVRTAQDRRGIVLSAAILTADGGFRAVGAPRRSSWPIESWIQDD